MKKLLALLILLPLFSSCSAGSSSDTSRAPTPADYHEGDLSYTLTVSDEVRSVSLRVDRRDGVSSALVTAPEELAGTGILAYEDPVRILLKTGAELTLTEEVSAGLCLFLDAMDTAPASEHFSDGRFILPVEGAAVSVTLSEDGYPCLIRVESNGTDRSAEVEILSGN